MRKYELSRRKLLRAAVVSGAGVATVAALTGCGETQIVTETRIQEVIKEVEVEKIVTQIVEKKVEVEKIVEKEVEVEVEKVVIQEVEVEKIVTAAAAAKPAALTLVFATWWALEAGGFGKFEQEYTDLFASTNPHVTIDYQNFPFGELHTKLLTQIAAGQGPDCFAQSNVYYPKYIKLGGAYPISEFTKGNDEVDIDDFVPVSLALSS